MNRMQGLQTVRIPSRRLLLTLVVVALLAFIAGTHVDSFRSMLTAKAVVQPAPAGVVPWPGMWNGSGYEGSAPIWPAISDQAQTRLEWQAEHEAVRKAMFATPTP